MISLEDDMAQSMERALIFGAFLDALSAPTPAQRWLEQAAEQIRRDTPSTRSSEGGNTPLMNR